MRSAPTPLSEAVTCHLVRREADWDAIRHEWESLYAASPYASTPLDFAWLRLWWRIFAKPHETDTLQIVTIRRGVQLVGVLPLYERREDVRRLQFISTGEAEYEETCPDYLNLLCLPEEEGTCAAAVWDCLGRLDWDHLELVDLPEESPLFSRPTIPEHVRTFPRDTCPIADLEGGFDAYLARLSPNGRQQARRLVREGERAGATLAIADAADATRAFDDLVRLHQARWNAEGRPGVFAAQRFCSFHRQIIRDWLPTGRAVLARLFVAGAPAAVIYGFINRSTFEFYQSGVQSRAAERPAQSRQPRALTSDASARQAGHHSLRLSSRERRVQTAIGHARATVGRNARVATDTPIRHPEIAEPCRADHTVWREIVLVGARGSMTRAVSRLIGNTRLPSLIAPAARWSGVLALNYHRIGDGTRSIFDRGLWSCTADVFLDQIRFCKTGFDIITPMQLPDVLGRARGRYILITFDDGYLDNYQVAFPILASEGVPATFFVATGFIDSPRIAWWDEIAWMVRTSNRDALALPEWLMTPIRLRREREGAIRALLRTYKALRSNRTEEFLNDIAYETGSGRYDAVEGDRWWMTWAMLRQMRASGMNIGGHTVNHPVLARAPREMQLEEIRTCARAPGIGAGRNHALLQLPGRRVKRVRRGHQGMSATGRGAVRVQLLLRLSSFQALGRLRHSPRARGVVSEP